MHARGDGVGAPEHNEPGVRNQLDIDADAGTQGEPMPGAAGGRADRVFELARTEPVEEALGHGFALHDAHGSGVAIGEDLLGVSSGDGAEPAGDFVDGAFPGRTLEVTRSLFAHSSQRIQDAIGVIGTLRVTRDFGTQHAGGRSVRGSPGDFHRNAVSDMDLQRAGIGAVVGTGPLDDGFRCRGGGVSIHF